MKQDVLDALSGRFPDRIPCKESLDHPGLISHVAGFDVFDDTPKAFDIAWRKLSIDIHIPLPKVNAPRPRVPGGTWEENGMRWSDYGVYPTGMELEQEKISQNDNEVFNYDTSIDDFDQAEKTAELRKENNAFRKHFGDLAIQYHLYYTSLFMWPVVTFGWTSFMIAAATDPERFDEKLWQPWSRISRKMMESLAQMDEDVIFCHDDLTTTNGLVFPMEFYEKYIFSRYQWIMEPVHQAGKKLIFVCDGNMDLILERLMDFPIDGIMFENPATPFQRVLETWGKAGRGFIGGISTDLLTTGTPQEVQNHTREVIEKGSKYPGFIISSCGQLPGNIPMENILAYFEMRNEMGIPAQI